jgi:murein DD-endopeptidase MepM/ murein hydrolase activator NlpD
VRRGKGAYSILVIRDTGAKPFSFRISTSWVRLLTVFAVLFAAALIAFVIYYGRISVRVLTVTAAWEENERLRIRVADLEKLSTDVDKIRVLEERLRALAFEERPVAVAVRGAVPPSERRDPAFEKEIEDFVQNVKIQRNLQYLNAPDETQQRRQAVASMPNILPVDGWISRGFSDSAVADRSGHTGIDIAAALNTPVKAAAPGLVTFAGWKSSWGNLVEIDHGFGFVSRYGHCAQILIRKGDLVERSQTVALVGNSGRSTGPHLHFEVLRNGVQVDPLEFVLK